MVAAALLTGIWGGLLALERRAFLQAMISRPIVAGTGTGLIFEDAGAGLAVGVVFELLHLGRASFGGAHPDHEMLPAIGGAALAAALGSALGALSTPAMWTIAVLVFAPSGWVGRLIENRLDLRARKYLGRARRAADAGQVKRAMRQNLRAMWPQFVFYGMLAGLAPALGLLLAKVVVLAPAPLLRGLGWAYPVMGVVAAGIAAEETGAERRDVVALVGAVLAVAAAQLLGAHWP